MFSIQARSQLSRISARACSNTVSSLMFSHLTISPISLNNRSRSCSCASSVGNRSGFAEGSSTICAKITARAAASGRRAHHRCSVLGCPCRIDFSRTLAALIEVQRQRDLYEFLPGLRSRVPSMFLPWLGGRSLLSLPYLLTNLVETSSRSKLFNRRNAGS